MTKDTRFTAALAVAMTIITLVAPGAKAGQLSWYFHASDSWATKPLSEYFAGQGMPLNAGNTHVFLVLGDSFITDLDSGAFDPGNVTLFYSGTDYVMSTEYYIKSDSLGPGSDGGFPLLQYALLTLLVISVNEGDLGDPGCQYDYYYIQRSTYVRTDEYSGVLTSQNVYGTITSGSSVPEPATGLLVLGGAAVLLLRRRKKN